MIRAATPEDIPRLIELGVRFMRDGTYWGERREISPPDFADHLSRLMCSPIAGFFVAESKGDVIGAIAAILVVDVFSGGTRAMKLHWLVDPAHGGIGLRLEARARKWAAERGASAFTMSALNKSTATLLERLGYRRTEIFYSKAI